MKFRYILFFYFLYMDNYITMHDPNWKLYICIENIVVEGTVSQIVNKGLGSFSTKSRKKIGTKYKKLPIFLT